MSRRLCTSSAFRCTSRKASPAVHRPSRKMVSSYYGTGTADCCPLPQEQLRSIGCLYWPRTGPQAGKQGGYDELGTVEEFLVGDWWEDVEEHGVRNLWAKRFWSGKRRSHCPGCILAVTEVARRTCKISKGGS